MAASQVERTLSEVASSLSAGIPKYSPHDAAYAQIRYKYKESSSKNILHIKLS